MRRPRMPPFALISSIARVAPSRQLTLDTAPAPDSSPMLANFTSSAAAWPTPIATAAATATPSHTLIADPPGVFSFFLASLLRRRAAGRDRLLDDRIAQHADALDLDLAYVAVAHPQRRLARVTDAGRRAHGDDVARLKRHPLGHVDDRFGDLEHHVVGVVGLEYLAVNAALDLEPL